MFQKLEGHQRLGPSRVRLGGFALETSRVGRMNPGRGQSCHGLPRALQLLGGGAVGECEQDEPRLDHGGRRPGESLFACSP